ncbi:endonuclease domain-containing protein [Sphingomonas sp. GCM10030256]|uniref:endonuclease domain-containing protein n=1 Tax=Sphingomonas sp. GCM10030256 TaxID=3273427 RepID=UPI00361CC553
MKEPCRRPTNRAQHLRNHSTDAERHLWRCLSRRPLFGFKLSRQMPVGPYICDLLCREGGLAVERDGGQHAERTVRDARRTGYLNAKGVRVLRFWSNEVLANTGGVLEAILVELERLPSRYQQPLPQAGGEKL